MSLNDFVRDVLIGLDIQLIDFSSPKNEKLLIEYLCDPGCLAIPGRMILRAILDNHRN